MHASETSAIITTTSNTDTTHKETRTHIPHHPNRSQTTGSETLGIPPHTRAWPSRRCQQLPQMASSHQLQHLAVDAACTGHLAPPSLVAGHPHTRITGRRAQVPTSRKLQPVQLFNCLHCHVPTPTPTAGHVLASRRSWILKPLQLSAAKGWLLPPPSAARMHTAIIAKSSLLRPSCGRHECWPHKSWAHAHSSTSAMIVKSPLLRPSCCRHQCWPSVSAGRMGRTAPLLSLHAPAGVQQPLPVCASAGLSTLAACAQVPLCYDCTPPLLLSSCCRHLCWPPATCAQQHSRCCQRKCRPPFSAGRMREATPLR